jgi:hypothetical protein
VNDLGLPIRQLTNPAQLDNKRFDLEWVLPLEPGLSTHVTILDLECAPPHAVAVGEGADEADALLALWTSLTAQDGSAAAVARVTEAYTRRTGCPPEPAASDAD